MLPLSPTPLELNQGGKTQGPPSAHHHTLTPSIHILSMRKFAKWPNTRAARVRGCCTQLVDYEEGVPSETWFSRTLTLTPNPNPNLFGTHTERRGSECVVDYKVVCSCKTSESDKL